MKYVPPLFFLLFFCVFFSCVIPADDEHGVSVELAWKYAVLPVRSVVRRTGGFGKRR
jgi:hypothetical protein